MQLFLGSFLVSIHVEKLVADHQKAWGYLLEATCNTEIKEKLVACSCVPEVWEVIQGWSLPTSDAEKALLVRQLDTVQMFPGEDPELFLARVDKLVNTMRVIGIEKSESEIVQIIVRQLSDDYDVEKRSSLSSSGITRAFVEHTIRQACLYNRVLPAETEENSMCPGFNLRVPPRVGANRRVCITTFYLRKPGKIPCVLVLTCACPQG